MEDILLFLKCFLASPGREVVDSFMQLGSILSEEGEIGSGGS